MLEEIWFVLILWFIILILGFGFKEHFFVGLAGIIGIFLGFLTITDLYVWLGLIFIFGSFYLIYHSLFQMTSKRGS